MTIDSFLLVGANFIPISSQ